MTRRTTAVLPYDPSLVYEVLTDYDGYAEWMPFVARSKLLAREGDLAIAEIDFLKPRNSKLVLEGIHSRDQTVLGRTIGGEIPIAKLEWSLAPEQDGRTRVTFALEAKPHWRWLSPGCRHFLRVNKLLQALKTHLAAFVAVADIGRPGEDAETILEVVETSEGLLVWFRGQKYAMTPISGQRS